MTTPVSAMLVQLHATLINYGFSIDPSHTATGTAMVRTEDGIVHRIRYVERNGKLHATLELQDAKGRKVIDYRFAFSTWNGLRGLEFHLRRAQPRVIRFPLDSFGARSFSSLADNYLWALRHDQHLDITIQDTPAERSAAQALFHDSGFTYTVDTDTLFQVAERIIGDPLTEHDKAGLRQALPGITGATPGAAGRWELTSPAVMEFLSAAVAPVFISLDEPILVVASWTDRTNHALAS